MKYQVVQILETGEEVVAHEATDDDAAHQWIEDNADLYPEPGFRIDRIAPIPTYFPLF